MKAPVSNGVQACMRPYRCGCGCVCVLAYVRVSARGSVRVCMHGLVHGHVSACVCVHLDLARMIASRQFHSVNCEWVHNSDTLLMPRLTSSTVVTRRWEENSRIN